MNQFNHAFLSVLTAACLIFSSAAPPVHGQEEYKTLTPAGSLYILPSDTGEVLRNKKDKIRNVETQIREVLTGKVSLSEKQTIVDAWFVSYLFPTMTLTSVDALAKLPAERALFFKNLNTFTGNAEAHKYVVDLTLREMSKIALDAGFHPAVRYNAMLMIADLNAVETLRSGNTSPAEGHTPSLQFLLKQLEDTKQAEYIRVGALIGVVRHAQLDHFHQLAKTSADKRIANAEWNKMKSLLMELLKTRNAVGPPAIAAQDWLRRRAMEGLGWMAAARPEPELVKEIMARVADNKEARGVRREATVAIGNALYTGAVAVKPREAAIGIAQYMHSAVQDDIEFLEHAKAYSEEQIELYTGATSDAGTLDGPGGRNSVQLLDPYEYRLDPMRRRMQHEVGCALWGLIGSREKRKSAREPSFGLIALSNVKNQGDKEAKLNAADKKFVEDLADTIAKFSKDAEASDTTSYIAAMKHTSADLMSKIGLALPADPIAAPSDDKKKPAEAALPATKTDPVNKTAEPDEPF